MGDEIPDRLHPEGAPSPLRQVMGDEGYETQMRQGQQLHDAAMERNAAHVLMDKARTNCFRALAGLVTIGIMIGFAFGVELLIRCAP